MQSKLQEKREEILSAGRKRIGKAKESLVLRVKF
jgi:hypothetical protein